jgi:hypothetical protein
MHALPCLEEAPHLKNAPLVEVCPDCSARSLFQCVAVCARAYRVPVPHNLCSPYGPLFHMGPSLPYRVLASLPHLQEITAAALLVDSNATRDAAARVIQCVWHGPGGAVGRGSSGVGSRSCVAPRRSIVEAMSDGGVHANSSVKPCDSGVRRRRASTSRDRHTEVE